MLEVWWLCNWGYISYISLIRGINERQTFLVLSISLSVCLHLDILACVIIIQTSRCCCCLHMWSEWFYSACKLSHWATWRKPLTWQGALSQRWYGVSSEHPESPAHISGGFKSTWLLLREMWIKEVGGCRRNTFLKQTGVKVQLIGPWAQDIFCFRTNSELSWFFRSSGPRLQCSLV